MLFSYPRAGLDYRTAKLTQGKVWYIYFYALHPKTKKLTRVRIKLDRIRPKKERKRIALEMISDIDRKLSLGWNPFVDDNAPGSSTLIEEAFEAFLVAKAKEHEKASIASYRSYIKVFGEWLVKKKISLSSPLSLVSDKVAQAFMDHLEAKEGISPRTYNNYLSFLNTLWLWFVEKGHAFENVFSGIPKKAKKLHQKTRRMFEKEELEALFSYLDKENPEFLCVCLLCYCCFMRPKEIALLKCKDIDLAKQTVKVSEEIAKNDKDSIRTIPDQAMDSFRKLDLSQPDKYLFGKHYMVLADFTPEDAPCSHKKFEDFWKKVREALDFPLELQLYSLKDTGITNMASANVPINLVQQQADHSSLSITSIYVGKTSATKELKEVEILPKK